MTWHLDPITLHGRRYTAGKSFEARDKFATVVTVQIMGKIAYLSGMRNDTEQGPVTKEDFADLAQLLRGQYGVEVIRAERRQKPREYQTGPAPLT